MDPYQVILIAFILLFVVVFLVAMLLFWRYNNQNREVIKTARYLYDQALGELRQDPKIPKKGKSVNAWQALCRSRP